MVISIDSGAFMLINLPVKILAGSCLALWRETSPPHTLEQNGSPGRNTRKITENINSGSKPP